eukprot:g6934.t1
MLSLTSIGQALSQRKFLIALFAEFVGVCIYQLFGGSLPVKAENNQPDYTDHLTAATIAIANGFIFSSLGKLASFIDHSAAVYWSRHLSGGHLNPAVSLALSASGHMSLAKGLLYILVQILGGICGAVFSHLTMSGGSYCFDKESTDSSDDVWELFAWEILMTWLYIMVFYSCYLDPGHGDVGPLILGIAVMGCMWAGATHSGGVMNPARIISPTVANVNSDRHCQTDMLWYYVSSEGIGAILAAFCTVLIYGRGPNFRSTRPTERP